MQLHNYDSYKRHRKATGIHVTQWYPMALTSLTLKSALPSAVLHFQSPWRHTIAIIIFYYYDCVVECLVVMVFLTGTYHTVAA